MKKLFFSLVALSALFFVACSNKDKSTSNTDASKNIIGTWLLTGMQVNYYNANNQLVYSEHNIDGNVGQVQQKITNTMIYSYYMYIAGANAGIFTLIDSASYTLNTSTNPITLNIIDQGIGGTVNIPLLTNSQMVWSSTTKPDMYYDTTSGQEVTVDHSISLDTLAKQ
jgi:hypothetical protein